MQAYQPQNVAYETAKSAGTGFLATPIFYGLSKVSDGLSTGHWTLKPNSGDLSFSLAVGSGYAVFKGYEKFKKIKQLNERTYLLNKYAGQPDIQQDIMLEAAKQGAFEKYRPGGAEKTFGALSSVSLIAFVLSPLLSGNENGKSILLATTALATILTSLGWLGTHILGTNKAQKTEQDKLNFAEKLSLERAAARNQNITRIA